MSQIKESQMKSRVLLAFASIAALGGLATPTASATNIQGSQKICSVKTATLFMSESDNAPKSNNIAGVVKGGYGKMLTSKHGVSTGLLNPHNWTMFYQGSIYDYDVSC
jgi:uncharacterized protein (DUF1501 family)